MNIDRLRVLVEDLDYLEASWNAQIIPDSTLRRDSAILRRLLVDLDRVLATAWRELGFTKGPKIVAPDLDRLLGLIPNTSLDLAVAGIGKYENVEGHFFMFGPGDWGGALGARTTEYEDVSFKLESYLDSTGLLIESHKIKRREVIKYVANKLGGVHFDTTRKSEEKSMQLMDACAESFLFFSKNTVYFELLAIGQNLVKSPDIVMLKARARQHI